MDDKDGGRISGGGESVEARQRKTATEIVRRKVLDAYRAEPTNYAEVMPRVREATSASSKNIS